MKPLARRFLTLFPLIWILAGFCRILAAQDDLPDGKGKVTLENTCTECHGLDKVLSKLRTEGQWREMAVRMRSKGATMSDDELNALVEYLSQNFGAVETKVNINKASAREIELVTGLRAADSAAIVHYRGAKGPFKGWRDLTKVAGIDKSRLEAARDRITFH